MAEAKLEGTWAVVASTPIQHIGRIVEPRGTLDELRKAPRLILNPAFEFVTPIIPTSGGLQRVPTVMPVGATMHPVPVSVTNLTIYFLEEMTESDQENYAQMIQQAEDQRTEARAMRAGLTTARNPGPMRDLGPIRGGRG